MNKPLLVSAIALGLGCAASAHAALQVSASVGGAPTGVSYYNFDSDPPNGLVSSVSFTGNAGFVTGAASGVYAPPFVSNGNGAPFGNADGPDASRYVTSGKNSTATIAFSSLLQYVGLLWGSVDNYNSLDFYDGATLVGTVVGNDITGSPTGDQGVNGTFYVNVVSTLPFDRLVARSSEYAFEFDNLAYNPTDPGDVPEPASLALFGLGLAGVFAARRRRAD
jgi:hypothetical protein